MAALAHNLSVCRELGGTLAINLADYLRNLQMICCCMNKTLLFPSVPLIYRCLSVGLDMVKRKSQERKSKGKENGSLLSSTHWFLDEEKGNFRNQLLVWYDGNKRDLPWRHMAKLKDINQRAYAVWVSEIMLQQTQVATVIDYYNKWMKKWPTLQALSAASLEEVNEAWSGLGYYSRGRRLHEGAQKVVNELEGQMPSRAADLLKELPGVGKYTAGAIASIAFEEVTGLVDGNVVRVFSRMRIIGAECSSQSVTDALWSIANCVVDPTHPGDFNQGLMELGATVCTPKAPNCSICPVSGLCKAYKETCSHKRANEEKLLGKNGSSSGESDRLECDIEDCDLCLPASEPWDSSIGVMNYPRKAKKKAPREEMTAVGIVSRDGQGEMEYLITQRPETGLLANLWEFPSAPLGGVTTEGDRGERLSETLQSLGSSAADAKKEFIGEVVHIFSHIHQTYLLYRIKDTGCHESPAYVKVKWVTKEQFLDSAVSTAMKKVFRMYESKTKPAEPANSKPRSTNRKRQREEQTGGRKQMAIDGFFKPKAK